MSTSTTTTCRARRVSDQMNCPRCGYVWDTNDPDPPVCKTERAIAVERAAVYMGRIREKLRP